MSDPRPYTMEDVKAWVEMQWEREHVDENVMARIRATVEENVKLRDHVCAIQEAALSLLQKMDDQSEATAIRHFAEDRSRLLTIIYERDGE